MQWQSITDSELFTSLINTCRKTVDKCSLSSNSPKSAKEFDGKLSLGDTYLLFQSTRERRVLQLESVKYQHSQYQIKTGVFSSGTVHKLDFGEAVVSVLHGDNYQVLASHLGAIIPRINQTSSTQRISNLKTTNHIQTASNQQTVPDPNTPAGQDIKRSKHRGLAGITRKIENVRESDDKKIDAAFQEGLKGLSKAAKDMIDLSNRIEKSMKEKTGGISEDETTNLRAALLSLGLDNSDEIGHSKSVDSSQNMKYFQILQTEAKKKGGVLLLSDVFCIINRLKGFSLISPSDAFALAKNLTETSNCTLQKYDSGAIALEFESGTELYERWEELAVRENNSSDYNFITPEHLNATTGIPMLVARERLLQAEERGLLCRDFSVQGLRFFKNLFVA